ncbi:hypothetical protein [Spirosoma validum]|uniref:Uncharacterized protein n=1 Tax=Spirosoma validum TaxID=2771355 RepID=A0A927B766_9BACT|nr:hypothetical protein [Spirosoma validum]MBD2756629.1 hypothetical protein [Spirosoma validum]
MSSPTQSITYQPEQVAPQTSWYALLLCLVPVVLVGSTVITYALNLPYWDDFQVQEHLLLLKSSTVSQKIAHFFDQHWEHRIIWTRLVFVLFAKINGTLNYYGLTLIGFIGLLVTLGILFAVFRRLRYPLLYFVPVPFLLVTLQSYESLIWAMAAVQNFWVLAFALGTFYWLAQNTSATRLLALGLAVFTTFSGGNGALVLIAGLFVLTYQRQWRFLIVWFVATVLSLAGYFYTYHRISFFPSPFRYPIIDWFKAFFVFLGAFANPSPNVGTSLLSAEATLGLTAALGVVVVGMAVLFLISVIRLFSTTRVDIATSFFLSCFLFLLATAVITVYSRVGFAGPGYLLQSRYRIYSALALSIVYLYSLHRWRTKSFLLRYVFGVLLISISHSLFANYLCLEGIVNQHRRVVAEYFNYVTNTPEKNQQDVHQLYVPTERPFFSHELTTLSSPKWWSAPTTITVDTVDEQPFMYTIAKADALNPSLSRPDDGSYIFFKSLSHTYLFAARPLRPSSIIQSGFTNYFSPIGFDAQVLKEKLAPGRYRIGILTNRNNRMYLAMTNRYVIFTSL